MSHDIKKTAVRLTIPVSEYTFPGLDVADHIRELTRQMATELEARVKTEQFQPKVQEERAQPKKKKRRRKPASRKYAKK